MLLSWLGSLGLGLLRWACGTSAEPAVAETMGAPAVSAQPAGAGAESLTGGGNDLLLTDMSGGSGCNEGCMSTIGMVAARIEELWQEMGDDGVQDLTYIEYSEGGDNGASVACGRTKLAPLCEAAAPIRCHILHSDDLIMMMLLDGVHPTADGCSRLGQAAFDLMEKEGMRR